MRVPCFVDPISMTIKNTTRYYAPGGHTEVMWEINHNWYVLDYSFWLRQDANQIVGA